MWRDWQNYITNPRLEESKLYNRGDKIRNRNLWITNIIKMVDSWTTHKRRNITCYLRNKSSIIITSFDRFYYEQNQNELHAQTKIKKKTISR